MELQRVSLGQDLCLRPSRSGLCGLGISKLMAVATDIRAFEVEKLFVQLCMM